MMCAVCFLVNAIITVVKYFEGLTSVAAQMYCTPSAGISSSFRLETLDATIFGVIGSANYSAFGFIMYSADQACSPIWFLISSSFWSIEMCPSFSEYLAGLNTSEPAFISSKWFL